MVSLSRLRSLALALLLPVAMHASVGDDPAAASPVPAIQIPLDLLGYRPAASVASLRAGSTNATVHFIDADHLLLTYTARRLVKRLPDQLETDDDHFVRALVLHLPDGKIVRETEWRLHDRGPYLWALPDGHFLLRVRNDLYSLDPMGSYNPEHLGERLLLRQDNDLETIEFSPDRDLFLMQTVPARKIGDDPADATDHMVNSTFYSVRILADGSVQLASRGRAKSSSPFTMTFTSLGVLETVREDRMHWGFDFRPFAGGKMELAGFTSTCRPNSMFVSDAEFFAFGCRGGDDRRLMGGFNLMADAKWVFTTDNEPVWLAVESSPSTGRFALRNTLTSVNMQGIDRPDPDEIRAEEIRVYGNRDGNELLRVNTFPVQRPAGNFALSPDGLRLAVFQGPMLAVYNLPSVSKADRALHEKERVSLGPLGSSSSVSVLPAIAGGADNDAP